MKIIYNKTIFLTTITLMFLLTSCEFDETDLTDNPSKNTKQVTPELFTGTLLKTLKMHGLTEGYSSAGTTQLMLPHFYVQHLNSGTSSKYEIIRYGNPESYSNFEYKDYYNSLYALKIIQQYITDKKNKKEVSNSYGDIDNIYNVSEVLSVYLWQFITDTWGDIPYFEALQGADKYDPKFTSQKEIYYDLFKRIDKASKNLLKATNKSLFKKEFEEQDLYFKGDVNKWILFANSLHATMAMRIQNIDPNKAKIEFVKAYKSGLITTNEENLFYNFKNPYNIEVNGQLSVQKNPWSKLTEYWFLEKLCLSETFVKILKDRNDERLFSYSEKASSLKDKTGFDAYVGLGYNYPKTQSISESAVSTLNKAKVRDQYSPIYFYTFAQTCFLNAEAAQRGWISGSAQDFYKQGIKASMNQWGITDNVKIDTYLTVTNVEWNDSKALQLIGEQMYIALFTQGFEAWFHWRRTGYPVLSPVVSAVDGRKIPRRYYYPSNEKTYNTKNYLKALVTQGDDTYSTRVWWDTK